MDPFDVQLKGHKQRVYVDKGVTRLLASEVPVVGLAGLVTDDMLL